jgi:hypothetical protein
MHRASPALALFLVMGIGCGEVATTPSDPLPAWRAGATRDALVSFVTAAGMVGGPGYIPPAERIAVFDNDGTLWSEQPMYVQLAFAIDRVKAQASEHPEWQSTEPFRSVLAGDIAGALAGGTHAIMTLVMATHGGMTTAEFEEVARDWITTARHPVTGRLYTEMVYQPMLELLTYLRANGFKTYIVSGGGIEFMRPWTEQVYGIPPEQVIGSSIRLRYELRGDRPVLVRDPEIDFIDDGPGKPVGIQKFIGRRPVLAFGNSDGDLAMLQWTAAGSGPSLIGIIHHTDGVRDYAYDRVSSIGHLDKALDEGTARGWLLVDMARDWATVYPPKP